MRYVGVLEISTTTLRFLHFSSSLEYKIDGLAFKTIAGFFFSFFFSLSASRFNENVERSKCNEVHDWNFAAEPFFWAEIEETNEVGFFVVCIRNIGYERFFDASTSLFSLRGLIRKFIQV